MSKTPKALPSQGDPLSLLLDRIALSARVYLRAEFCGTWAVDSSGQRRAPFHLVTRGTGWLHASGVRPRLLTAGELVLFPRDSPHTLSHSEAAPDPDSVNRPPPAVIEEPATGLVCGYFAFDPRSAAPLLDALPDTIVLDLASKGRSHGTVALMHLLMGEALDDELGADAAIDRLAYVVFIHILREQITKGHLRGPLGALADARLGPVLNLIHANPGDSWSVATLAETAGMSRSALAQRFKQRVGMSVARYVTHWRMQEAIELLRSSRFSVAAIAERCGYASEVAFRKAFRAYVGIPPGKFRRDAAGSDFLNSGSAED